MWCVLPSAEKREREKNKQKLIHPRSSGQMLRPMAISSAEPTEKCIYIKNFQLESLKKPYRGLARNQRAHFSPVKPMKCRQATELHFLQSRRSISSSHNRLHNVEPQSGDWENDQQAIHANIKFCFIILCIVCTIRAQPKSMNRNPFTGAALKIIWSTVAAAEMVQRDFCAICCLPLSIPTAYPLAMIYARTMHKIVRRTIQIYAERMMHLNSICVKLNTNETNDFQLFHRALTIESIKCLRQFYTRKF